MIFSFAGAASPQSAMFSFLNSRILGGLDELQQVEAKYPALLFKQQLTAFLEKIYGMISDNLKKEISPLLGFCIQVTAMLSSFPIFYYHIFLLPYISFFGDFIIVKYIFFTSDNNASADECTFLIFMISM